MIYCLIDNKTVLYDQDTRYKLQDTKKFQYPIFNNQTDEFGYLKLVWFDFAHHPSNTFGYA
jgi:hypothetical protein